MPESIHVFADALDEIMPVLIREFLSRQGKNFSGVDVTPPQMVILGFLGRHGPSKMNALAKAAGSTTAAATGMIERMFKAGLVARYPQPGDRRVILVAATPKGQKLFTDVMKQRKQFIIETFGKLSAADRAAYLRILTRIKDMLLSRDGRS